VDGGELGEYKERMQSLKTTGYELGT